MSKEYKPRKIEMIIYKAKNKLTGMLYIGQSKFGLKYRKKSHEALARRIDPKKTRIYFLRALRKHGPLNFEWDVLEVCRDEAHMDEREQFYIKLLDTIAPKGYNMVGGGAGYKGISDELRERISKKIIALHQDPEYRAKTYPKLKGLVPPNKGQLTSDETKERQSASRIALMQEPGFIHPSLGIKKTPEQREAAGKGKRISGDEWKKVHKGTFTEEVRAKMSAARLGKKPVTMKKVICIESGIEYESGRAAALALKLHAAKISDCCRGTRKSTGGLHFKFA